MPSNPRGQTAQSPASPTSQSTAKYINKDGSKYITVPKANSSADSVDIPPIMAQHQTKTNGPPPQSTEELAASAPAVNRKKQKRRERDKAKKAEDDARANAAANQSSDALREDYKNNQSPPERLYASRNGKLDTGDRYGGDESDDYSSVYAQAGSPRNGYTKSQAPNSLNLSKNKGKSKASLSEAYAPDRPQMPQKKIWNTSGPEERESIKAFWLSLGEEERRSLVKVEKDAVLKKMKEQQKHSCSCTVCGRKRVAIEEELEVLYDAYYEELENYANRQHGDTPIPLESSHRFGPMNNLHPPHRIPQSFSEQQPSRGRIIENFDDDDGDEDYSEEDADADEYLSDELVEETSRSPSQNDFFNFGQSLTVKGGILTVADDLLKNDGRKFIEMMEQLAERRMAREEDQKDYPGPYGHLPGPGRPLSPHHHTHNHGPPQDDDDYDDEEDSERSYDSQDDEYDEEEMNTMTDEQRMEEGRRMFQIFAARMFEQRVLTAWKEKLAVERRKALLDEEDTEKLAEEQKKAKKAEAAAKKKEKAQLKKATIAEEKRKKEELKAAEEAKVREAEEKKAEALRIKGEEKRKRRDAQKKAEEEERFRKEAEKLRRLQEQKDRQAEQERKIKEAKEREKKEKEEQRQREKELKEKEAKERKEKQEREKSEADAKAKADKDAREPPQLAAIPAVPVRRAQHAPPIPVAVAQPAPPFLPQVPVATPVAKAPTPNRSAPLSQKDATSIPPTPQVAHAGGTPTSSNMTPLNMSPDPAKENRQMPHQAYLHHPQAASPMHTSLKSPPGTFISGPPFGTSSQPINMGFPSELPLTSQGFGGNFQSQQNIEHHSRPMPQNGMNIPPVPGTMAPGRGFSTGYGYRPPQPRTGIFHTDEIPVQTHSRQQSGSYDASPFDHMAQMAPPISRPPPIGRPLSVNQNKISDGEIGDLSNTLRDVELSGSGALLDDSEELDDSIPASVVAGAIGGRRPSGPPGLGRQPFPSLPQVPHGIDNFGFSTGPSNFRSWETHFNNPLPPPSMMANWGTQGQASFGGIGTGAGRPSQPRNAALRQMIVETTSVLASNSLDGWITSGAVKKEVDLILAHRHERPISMGELEALFDTEGDQKNGGGYFETTKGSSGQKIIRFIADPHSLVHSNVGAPGEIRGSIAQGDSRFGGGHNQSGF